MTRQKEITLLIGIIILVIFTNIVSALIGSIGPAKNIFHTNSSENFSDTFTINLENKNSETVIVNLSVDESIADFITLEEENFILNIYDSQDVTVNIDVPQGGGDYNGDIIAMFSTEPQENTTQQSITVSSQVVILDEINFVCGDGIINGNEECEEGNIPKSCSDYGFNAGSLSCTATCTIDSSGCSTQSSGGGGSSGGGSSSGGSSGGGGGGFSGPLTYLINPEQLKNYTTKNLSQGERFKFNMLNGTHYVTLDEISITSVKITVSSDPQTFVLDIGEEKKVDVNSDDVYDLSIILNNIAENKSEISVKEISETVLNNPEENTPEENTGINNSEIAFNENQEGEVSGITGAVIGFAKNKKNIGLVFALLVIIAGAAITIIKLKK